MDFTTTTLFQDAVKTFPENRLQSEVRGILYPAGEHIIRMFKASRFFNGRQGGQQNSWSHPGKQLNISGGDSRAESWMYFVGVVFAVISMSIAVA